MSGWYNNWGQVNTKEPKIKLVSTVRAERTIPNMIPTNHIYERYSEKAEMR